MKYFIVLFYILYYIYAINCFGGDKELKRKLTSIINPGCPLTICDKGEHKQVITLVHVQGDSDYDSLHHIWDFTHKPTILTALTPLNTTLNIDWAKYKDGAANSIEFSVEPTYVFSMFINSIWEFDDHNDTGYFENQKDIYHFDTDSFDWIETARTFETELVSLSVTGRSKYQRHGENIMLKFNSYAEKSRGTDVPHLLHSSNSTEIDIVLQNVTIERNMQRPRFALELIFITSEMKANNDLFVINQRKSLDDEHTPGIFSIIDNLSPSSYKYQSGGFIQYRPVSYTSKNREVSFSTETHQSAPIRVPSENFNALNKSLALAYFGEDVLKYPIQGVNVSFGLSGDGFYTRTNFTTFTCVMGYGAPPVEDFSTFVIVVASIGLGIPLFLFLGGCLYIGIKRLRN